MCGGWGDWDGISCRITYVIDVINIPSSTREHKRNIQEVDYQTKCGSMNGQKAHNALTVLPPSGAEDATPPG